MCWLAHEQLYYSGQKCAIRLKMGLFLSIVLLNFLKKTSFLTKATYWIQASQLELATNFLERKKL